MQPGTMAKEKGKYSRQTEGYGIGIARLFVRQILKIKLKTMP
jgi:hypothetical protein